MVRDRESGIARALFSKPEIMILDEATNSLDKENENKIIEEILENTNNKTIIMISHRHSNIKNFDKIYNIHEGKVFLNEKFESAVIIDSALLAEDTMKF